MSQWDDRTLTLLGDEALQRLRNARVFVAGLGGVGGYAAEMLCRSGIGHMTIADSDNIDITNLNRQIIALRSNLGHPKTEEFRKRFLDINPEAEIVTAEEFITPENVAKFIPAGTDFVLDAIDTVAPKTALILHCLRNHIPIISSMGAGGRRDPSKVVYADISETRDDGLARAIRQRLKKADMRRRLPVVCSTEPPHTASLISVETRNKRSSFGTVAMVPATFGIFMAAAVVDRIIKQSKHS